MELFKMNDDFEAHEKLVQELNDDALRAEYAAPLNDYKSGVVPRFLGWCLVTAGNIFYGEKPSYEKFKAVEVIARIPYQSWESVSYTLLTAFHAQEKYAVNLCKMVAFGRFAQDNETMHVVVLSEITRRHGKCGIARHTLVPLIFAFFYFWIIYVLYFISRKSALELNYLFESHAYEQYDRFLKENEACLKREPVNSEFLAFYGREVRNEWELFSSIRNDELIHRNRSIREIEHQKRVWEF